MTNPKQTSVVVRETFEVSTKPQFGHRLISRAADDAIGFIPSPENVIEQKSTIRFFRFDFGSLAAIEGPLGMIWSLDKAWSPDGGSEALAKEAYAKLCWKRTN